MRIIDKLMAELEEAAYTYCIQQHYACIVHLFLVKSSTKLVGSNNHRERIVIHYREIKTLYQEDTYTNEQ